MEEKKEALKFEIKKIDPRTGARLGVMHLPHGDVETPVFMPVGTQATVKAMTTDELKDMIKQLGEIVKMTQAANQQSSNKDDIDDIADLVYITNNSIGKQIISTDRLGQNSIVIKPAEKNRPIERDYIKQAMNIVQMRRLFEYGILEFEDERYYKIYGINYGWVVCINMINLLKISRFKL